MKKETRLDSNGGKTPHTPIHPAYPNVRKVKPSILLIALGLGILAALLLMQCTSSGNQEKTPAETPDLTQNTQQDAPPVAPVQQDQSAPPPAQQDQQLTTPTPQEQLAKAPEKERVSTGPKKETQVGVALRVSGNNAVFEPELTEFMSEVLQRKNITVYFPVNKKGKDNAVDGKFTIVKTPTKADGRDDAQKLVVKLAITARGSDNKVCFTQSYTGDAQILFPEESEKEVARRSLYSLRETIHQSGLKACAK